MNNVYNNHFQDHHMFPTLTRVHNRRTWIQCPLQQWMKKGAKPERARLCQAKQRMPHYRFPEAESWPDPIEDCHTTVSLETDYSKPAAHPCTLCDPAPNNWTDKMAQEFGWLLHFQCPKEFIDLQNIEYKFNNEKYNHEYMLNDEKKTVKCIITNNMYNSYKQLWKLIIAICVIVDILNNNCPAAADARTVSSTILDIEAFC